MARPVSKIQWTDAQIECAELINSGAGDKEFEQNNITPSLRTKVSRALRSGQSIPTPAERSAKKARSTQATAIGAKSPGMIHEDRMVPQVSKERASEEPQGVSEDIEDLFEENEEEDDEEPRVPPETISEMPILGSGRPETPPNGGSTTQYAHVLVPGQGLTFAVQISVKTLALYYFACTLQPNEPLTLGDFFDACAEDFFVGRGKDLGMVKLNGGKT